MFTDYYDKLANLNFEGFRPKLVAGWIISHEENQIIQRTTEHSRVASIVLDNIVRLHRAGVTLKFDRFLTILENDDDVYCHISGPIQVFEQFSDLMKCNEARKVIKGFNKMIRVLVELHHQAWVKQVCSVKS